MVVVSCRMAHGVRLPTCGRYAWEGKLFSGSRLPSSAPTNPLRCLQADSSCRLRVCRPALLEEMLSTGVKPPAL